MKLERFETGETAAALAANNSANPKPTANQEYLSITMFPCLNAIGDWTTALAD
mgnify:CR=1 FL=1